MEVYNTDKLSEEFIWQDSIGLITKSLGAAAGSRKIYVNVDSVPPNAYSTKYHSHSQQEEFFLIISGTGILRLNDEEIPVKQGDFFAKPAAQNIAHTFYNSGAENLLILDVGTTEKEDTLPPYETPLHIFCFIMCLTDDFLFFFRTSNQYFYFRVTFHQIHNAHYSINLFSRISPNPYVNASLIH